jgi:tetratricopeptide (TPR) repeat protein
VQALPAAPGPATRCERCGALLSAAPRFVELWGTFQHLDAVLAAWAGDPEPLATLLPERPAFLTDLTPPVPQAGDPAKVREALAALARGDWRAVLTALDPPTGAAASAAKGSEAAPRAHAARAIALERSGETDAAIAAWDAVLAAGEDERARLARGALLARAGRRAEAEADLWRAGGSFAARWDRAAWLVHEAMRDGVPAAVLLARARAESGEASAYWSDPTVGRLAWSLRLAQALTAGAGTSDAEMTGLRAAEALLEHDTFWDRALLLVGWVRVGSSANAARIAQPLARAEALALTREPALAGAPLRDVARSLADALEAIDAREPGRARHALAGALARADLKRFRLPCARCHRGSIGVDEVFEASTGEG